MKQFIICPNCGAIELATIEETVPFWSYIHDCAKCNYCTMESEWNTAKAISIKQPWGHLIVSGFKDVENRTWKTNFRGRVLIHVGAKCSFKGNYAENLPELYWPLLSENEKGKLILASSIRSAIIGSVEIVDCVVNHESIWADKTPIAYLGKLVIECQPPIYNWVLANPVIFEKPILNVKGKLSFFIPQLPQDV